jgi:hypothetical protein
LVEGRKDFVGYVTIQSTTKEGKAIPVTDHGGP